MRSPAQATKRLGWGLAFISPWLVGCALFVLWPFAATLYWSFCSYDLLSDPQWVGGANYRRLAEELLQGERFGQALWNTVYYAGLSVPLSVMLGVTLARLLARPMRGQAFYRLCVYLPALVPTVAASILWLWLLDPQEGLVNAGLRPLINSWNGLAGDWLHVSPPGWFQSVREAANPSDWSPTADPAGGWRLALPLGSKDGLVLMSLWAMGNSVLIYVAASGDIPRELYEAAQLDGAGRWARFRHVTLPHLTPVILFNVVIGLIDAVQAFTAAYLTSGGDGGPAGSSMLLALHLFLAAFKELQFGYASTLAWLLLICVALLAVVLFRTSRHWVYYRGLRS